MARPSRRTSGGSGRTSGGDVDRAAHIVGLPELRRELKKLENPRTWTKELAGTQRTVAREVAGWAQTKATGMGGPPKQFAKAIQGRGTVSGARIAIGGKKSRNGGAAGNAAFWGAKKRTGFYARTKYRNSKGRQHAAWIGASWDVAVRGQGPIAINDTLAEKQDQIVDRYGEAIDALTKRAFPD